MKKIVLFLFVLFWAVPVYAVQILATVQDEIITDVDVDERSSLVSELFNVSPNETLKKQILDDLVNEKIKVLTAKKQGIELSEAEIDDGISFMPSGIIADFKLLDSCFFLFGGFDIGKNLLGIFQKILQLIQLGDNAGDVADAICVGIAERLGVNFIKHCIVKPLGLFDGHSHILLVNCMILGYIYDITLLCRGNLLK